MARRRSKAGRNNGDTAASLGHKARLRQIPDGLRGSTDAAEYKRVALGLFFRTYIPDTLEEIYVRLEADHGQGAKPEDPDEYGGQNTDRCWKYGAPATINASSTERRY